MVVTLQDITQLKNFNGASRTVIITDPLRGGVFNWSGEALSDDDGTVFSATIGVGEGFWVREYFGAKKIEWWGAVGDGVTDDTAPIQSALTSLVAGETMLFNKGNYIVSSDLTFTADNVIIDGDGCTITETTLTTATITGSGSDNSIIRNFTFLGTENLTNWQAGDFAYRSASRNFVRFLNCTNVIIENITGSGKRGNVYLQNCFDSTARNNYQTGFFGTFTSTTIPSISDPQYCRNVTMTSGRYNTAEANSAYQTGAIVTFSQNGFNNIINNHGEYLHDNGIYNSSGAYNNFIGNHIQWVVGSGIKSRGNSNLILENNIRHVGVGISCTGDGTTAIDSFNTNGRYCEVSSNTISDVFNGPSISILDQDGYYSRDIKITNNSVFEHNSTGGQNAIRIIAVKGVIFCNNTIQDVDSDYAVEIRGVVSPVQINRNAIIRDNQIYNCLGGFVFNYLEDSDIINNMVKTASGAEITATNCNNNRIIQSKSYSVGSGISFDATCTGNKFIDNVSTITTNTTNNIVISDPVTSGTRLTSEAAALAYEPKEAGTGFQYYTSGTKSLLTGASTSMVLANGTIVAIGSTVRAQVVGSDNGSSATIVASTTNISNALWQLQNQVLLKSNTANPTFTGIVTSPAYKLSALQTAPLSATDTGTTGEIRVVADYIYVCIATDTWVRTALTTW